jgi:hypothetical protein
MVDFPMRRSLRPLLIMFLLVGYPALGQPEVVDQGRNSADSEARLNRDEARWADLEAQRRATDGDYDGAVQAHQQAEQDWQEARRQEMLEQSGH